MLTESIQSLKAMHLYGMATALAELEAERPRSPPSPEVWLKRLIQAEQVDRQTRSLRYQLRVARFPMHRDFTGFDWQESSLDEAQVQQLATGAFMEAAHNLILVGGTGTGKTHVAIALAQLSQLAARAKAMCLILREVGSEGLHYTASGVWVARVSWAAVIRGGGCSGRRRHS